MCIFSSGVPFPKRYMTVLLTSIGMCIVHAQRVNMGVTVVTILDEYPEDRVGKGQARTYLPHVAWSPGQIGFLHSVFFIGYFITQVPGGYLVTKLPCHRMFAGSILLTCGFNLFLPVCISHAGYHATCLVRFVQGIAEGFLFPSCYAILWHWSIPSERSRLGALVLAGVYFGPVLGLPLSGAITHYMRWDLVYYFFGALGVLWSVIWISLAYESPAQHPGISDKESEYIKDQQKETNVLYQDAPIPWGSILTSLPVQAINVCHFARSFALFLLITNEPAYLNVFGYGLATNGALSALPHLGKAALALGSGPVADYLLSHPRLTPTTVRKLFTCIGFGGQSVCYFLLFWFDTGPICVTFLAIGSSFSGITVSGWNINHLDLAPRFASILVAISTSVGTCSGIVMPLIVGYMTSEQVIEEWQNVFLLTSGILAFAVIVYAIFGSAKKQKWADPPPPEVMFLLGKSDPSRRKMYQTINLTQPQLEAGIYPGTEVNKGQLPVAQQLQQPPLKGAAVAAVRREGSSPEELERDIEDGGVVIGVEGESARLSNVTTRPSRVKSDSDEIDITANDSHGTDNRTGEAVVRRREPKIQ